MLDVFEKSKVTSTARKHTKRHREGGDEANIKDAQESSLPLCVVYQLFQSRLEKETNMAQIIFKPRTLCTQTNTPLLGI